MERPDIEERLRHSRMEQYLLADERVIIAQRQHWIQVAEPIASAVAGFFVVLTLDSYLPARLGVLTNALWWVWFVLVGRTIWKVLDWRQDWFVATDKRMLLNYGLINKGVAMLSLSRVVDLTYTRSWLGQLLGYGTLVRESVGQHQTLHKVKWVKHPHTTYLTICAAIFNLDHRKRGTDPDQQGEEGEPSRTANRYAGFVTSPQAPGTTDPSTGIHTRPAEPADDRDWWQPEPEPAQADSEVHEADTGPIPY